MTKKSPLPPEKRQAVLEFLRTIPYGYVATYRGIAKKTGLHPRTIATVMRTNADPETYPCYRVVHADGTMSGYALGVEEKRRRLIAHGIRLEGDRIPADQILPEA